MLRHQCPECKEWIHSPFLVDYKQMQCPSCSATVEVSDLYISAGPFSIHRDVLRKNMFKYTRLLMEAEKELTDVKDAVGKFKADAISTKSIAMFIENLKAMLSGCRDSTRFSAQGLSIRFIGPKGSVEAKLINISTTGTCVDIGESAAGYRKGDEVAVELGGAGRGRLPGKVVWAGKGPVGIRFNEMDEATRQGLFEFLRDKGEVRL